MKKIVLDDSIIKILVAKLKLSPEFIKEALGLTVLPELDYESDARTIEEAKREQASAEYCCDDVERAAIRRWLQLAEKETDIMDAFERISCDDGDPERMLAVRLLALVILVEQLNKMLVGKLVRVNSVDPKKEIDAGFCTRVEAVANSGGEVRLILEGGHRYYLVAKKITTTVVTGDGWLGVDPCKIEIELF